MSLPLRIATFNLENLDADPTPPVTSGSRPSLARRIQVMRPQLLRLRADILCLQEVHAQEGQGGGVSLDALQQLLANTPYAGFHLACTKTQQGRPFRERNLVVLSRFPIQEVHQVMNELVQKPAYRMVTANPAQLEAKEIGWERPLLHVEIDLQGSRLHMINLHLKSKMPVPIDGQYNSRVSAWMSVDGWAEGYFLSSLKRIGQALEARRLIDRIFENDEAAWIAICGDFNADFDDVPIAAIRGQVEETGNPALANRIMIPCEFSVPESSRYSLLHLGQKTMLDHILVSRGLLGSYLHTEIHNEALPDESGAFHTDIKFPESDHAPVVAEFLLS